jgi:hypothetical protein
MAGENINRRLNIYINDKVNYLGLLVKWVKLEMN